MIEVEVRNFQSIEKATFQIDGFTVIVGRSNIGKSALVRAVKAALTGASASSFVRHGPACLRKAKQAKTCKCHASVHLKAQGFDLLWEKGDAINRYTFNGQVYDKAERGTPTFLTDGFSSVKVGDRQELLQVADQFSPIFLLDQTGGAVADTLSDVARLDRINLAMRLAEKDRKEAVSTQKVRQKDIQVLESRLQTYSGLDDVLTEVDRLTTQQATINSQETALSTVDDYLAQLSAVILSLKNLSLTQNINIPDASELKATFDQLADLAGFISKSTERSLEVSQLNGVDDIQVPSLQTYLDLAQRHSTLSGWVDKVVTIKDWVVSWKPLEGAPHLTTAPIVSFKEQADLLTRLSTKFDELGQEIKDLDASLILAVNEVRELTEEQRELGVCPTCIRPLSECSEGGT